MKARYFIAAIAASMLTSVSYAQGMQTLEIVPDATSLSLGGVSTVAPVSGNATRVNSASMAFYEGTVATAASFATWAPSLSGETILSAGMFYKLGDKLAVGLDASKYDAKEYDVLSQDGISKGKFKPSDLIIGLGASYLLADGLSVGATGRFANSSIAPEVSGNAFSADLSLLWKKDALKAGASLQNLGTKISYGAGSYMIPLTASAGASYEISGITAMAQADYIIAGKSFAAEAAAQYDFKDILFARAGFHFGTNNAVPTFVSLGIGVKYQGIGLDLCYLTASETLSNSLLAGLRFEF